MGYMGNENPLSIAWKKRYLAQPPEVRRKLDLLDNMNPKEYQLKVIKRKRKEIKTGDIFVLSPREGVYFYGKVLKANIAHVSKDPFIHGNHLIFIFNCKSREISLKDYKPDYNNLLIPPAIVTKGYWTQGYFYTIDNEEITEEEKNLDYGFYYIGKEIYLKENGIKIDHKPSILGTYGIATYTGIASEIERELIINPKLLEF